MNAVVRTAGRPSTWVALAIVTLAAAPPELPGSSGAGPGDIALGVAALLAARGVLASRQLAVARSVPALGFLAVATVTLVAAVMAPDFPAGLVGGVRFAELFFFIPVTVMIALRTRTDALVLIGALVGFALVEGMLGLIQYLTGTGAGIGAESVRAVGTFGAYNIGTLSHLTAMGFASCLAVAVVKGGRVRWWAGAGALVLLLANVAGLSRGAWVALAVTAVAVASRGRMARLLVAVVTALAAAGLLLPALASSGSPVGQRLGSLLSAGSEPDQSLIDRETLWRAAEHMTLDHPLTGIGPRAFPQHRDAYAEFSLLGSSDISFGTGFAQVSLDSPHSLYLLVASEQGLVAFFVYVTVLATVLVRALVRASRRRADDSTTVTLIGAGLLVYELVVMITGDPGGPGSILTGIGLGMAGWAAADIDLDRSRPRPNEFHPPTAAVRSPRSDGHPGAVGSRGF